MAHPLAAEPVEHEGQGHEPRPGRHLCDIGHPEPVRRVRLERAFHPVRGRTMARLPARGARAPTPAHPRPPRLTHQPSDPFAPDPAPPGRQARRVPEAPRRRPQTPREWSGPRRATPRHASPVATPRVVPAGGDTQHPAHRGHPMMSLIRPHELEDLPGTEPVSRANQAAAFFVSRALREADGSPDEAAASPHAPPSSDRLHEPSRRDPPDVPSGGSPARNTRTHERVPRACGPCEPTRPFDAGTPARRGDGFSTCRHLLRTVFRCPPNRGNSSPCPDWSRG